MYKNIIMFIITSILLVLGQALWKIASAQLVNINGIMNILSRLIVNIPFITGCFFYLIATGLWIYLLGQYEYSKIYPIFVGFCMIVSIICGVIFFKENNNLINKILGSCIILSGIFIIVKN